MLDYELTGGGEPQEPTPEYPDESQLRAYGDFTFLFLRTEKHANHRLREYRLYFQPPIDLRLYRILRIDGVPRAGITWGFLSEAAEEKLRDQLPLAPSDWLSGPHLWIMEVIAPFGGNLGARLTRAFLEGLPPERTNVRFPRFVRGGGGLKHFTEWYREPAGKWHSRRLRPADLKNGTR
jgi:hemolysin-activating ACP:hemolysin acyltransferase